MPLIVTQDMKKIPNSDSDIVSQVSAGDYLKVVCQWKAAFAKSVQVDLVNGDKAVRIQKVRKSRWDRL